MTDGKDNSTGTRVAVVAVHGVGDPAPGSFASPIAQLLANGGAVQHDAVGLRADPATLLGRLDEGEDTEHRRLLSHQMRGANKASPIPPESFSAARLRLPSDAGVDVDVFELNWRDLSRVGAAAGVFGVVRALYSILFGFSAAAERVIAAEPGEGRGLRAVQRLARYLSASLRIAIPMANVAVAGFSAAWLVQGTSAGIGAVVTAGGLGVTAAAAWAIESISRRPGDRERTDRAGGGAAPRGIDRDLMDVALVALAGAVAVAGAALGSWRNFGPGASLAALAVGALVLQVVARRQREAGGVNRRHNARLAAATVAGLAAVTTAALLLPADRWGAALQLAALLTYQGLQALWVVHWWVLGAALLLARGVGMVRDDSRRAGARRRALATATGALTFATLLWMSLTYLAWWIVAEQLPTGLWPSESFAARWDGSTWVAWDPSRRFDAVAAWVVGHLDGQTVGRCLAEIQGGGAIPDVATCLAAGRDVPWLLLAVTGGLLLGGGAAALGILPVLLRDVLRPPVRGGSTAAAALKRRVDRALSRFRWVFFFGIAVVVTICALSLGEVLFPEPMERLVQSLMPTMDWWPMLASALVLPALAAGGIKRLGAGVDLVFDVHSYLKVPPDPLTPAPRARMLARLNALLTWIEGQGYNRLVVVAHSQGTVISADLLRLRGGSRIEDFRYLTAGSPLRQLYAERFPAWYEWVERDATVPGAQPWWNLWQAGDLVGRTVFVDPESATARTGATDGPDAARVDVCVGDGTHTHYFDDGNDLVGQLLRSLAREDAPAVPPVG